MKDQVVTVRITSTTLDAQKSLDIHKQISMHLK